MGDAAPHDPEHPPARSARSATRPRVQTRIDDALVDSWSFAHVALGILLAVVLTPFWALVLLVLYEPLELLVLSPILDKRGISFANETLENSLMDIVFDTIGVLLGAYLVLPLLPKEFPLPF